MNNPSQNSTKPENTTRSDRFDYVKKMGVYYTPDGNSRLTGSDLEKAKRLDEGITERRKRVNDFKIRIQRKLDK